MPNYEDDEGQSARLKYEGDADGGVDNNIFDSVALPDLPVDHHHHHHHHHPHPLAHVTAPHARNDADAEAAAMAAAAMPDPATTHHAVTAVEAAVEAGMANQHVYGLPVRHHHHPQHSPLRHHPVPRPIIPMPEVMIPPKWLSRYEELKRYKEEHGDFNVPMDHEHNKQLNAWVKTQKQQYKMLYEGKPNHMSQARIDLLNEIGFIWSGEKRDKFWHDRYNELRAFHAKHGTTRIPDKYEAAPQLHTWVSLQRRQLKMCKDGRHTKLTEERIRMLEAVGLECNIRNSSTWMDRFMELKRYKDQYGDCNVPQKWKENPSLGRWVDNQKTQHKKLYDGKPTHLTIERIQLLVSLGFNWRRG